MEEEKIQEIKIKSLSDYVQNIVKNKNDDLFLHLYRGQKDDKRLLPKILRYDYIENEDLKSIEIYMLNEFKRKAISFLENIPDNDLEWLTIAQHFGLETRLLDWSENALTALWFCVEKVKKEEYGVVWEINTFNSSLDYIDGIEHEEPFDIEGIKFFKPPFINNRIVNQTSIFSIHEINRKINKRESIEENKYFKKSLKKYIIPFKIFNDLKQDLNIIGVNSSTIFPDLGGLCLNINEFLKDRIEIKRKIELMKQFISPDLFDKQVREKAIKIIQKK
jgi:hypothetical protein